MEWLHCVLNQIQDTARNSIYLHIFFSIKLSWFKNYSIQFSIPSKKKVWCFPSLFSNWRQKRQSSQAEIRTICWKQRDKTMNSSNNKINNESTQKREWFTSKNAHHRAWDNKQYQMPWFFWPEGSPSPWKPFSLEVPFPLPWKWCEVLQNNPSVLAMALTGCFKKWTLSWPKPGKRGTLLLSLKMESD